MQADLLLSEADYSGKQGMLYNANVFLLKQKSYAEK